MGTPMRNHYVESELPKVRRKNIDGGELIRHSVGVSQAGMGSVQWGRRNYLRYLRVKVNHGAGLAARFHFLRFWDIGREGD